MKMQSGFTMTAQDGQTHIKRRLTLSYLLTYSKHKLSVLIAGVARKARVSSQTRRIELS